MREGGVQTVRSQQAEKFLRSRLAINCQLSTTHCLVALCGLLACSLALPCVGEGSRKHPAKSGLVTSNAIHVPDVDGRDRTPLAITVNRAVVLLFVTNDCPIANSYAPEIQRIQKAYAGAKFDFYLVYVDPALSAKAAKQHARDYGYTFPALLDRTQALARFTGATVTPEAAIVGANGKVLYRGRIDDRYVDFGKSRAQPTIRDLRNALDAVAQGKPVPPATGRAIGCFLPPIKLMMRNRF